MWPLRNPFACSSPLLTAPSAGGQPLPKIQLDEIPELIRGIEVSRQAGYLSAEEASEWWFRIKAWKEWLELPEPGPLTAREQFGRAAARRVDLLRVVPGPARAGHVRDWDERFLMLEMKALDT